jgi:hypothetical protein
VFGGTGTGKSAFVHEAFILRPFEWWKDNKNFTKTKIKVILFAQERGKIYTIAKWLARKIFLDTGTLIPLQKMLGWWHTNLTMDEKNLIDTYRDYINHLCLFVDIVEGAQSPAAIHDYVMSYALKNGRIEEINEFKSIYIPNNENEIVIPIVDHLGLVKAPSSMKKDAIDAVSGHFQKFRDLLGYAPVAVSQINRELGGYIYKKVDTLEPTLDHIKESGRPGEDSDLVLSLFQPSRYKTEDPFYDIESFLDPTNGADYFRSIKVLKNSYGESDIRCGMAFMGSIGSFKELPRKSEMDLFKYENLFDGRYFREVARKAVNFKGDGYS